MRLFGRKANQQHTIADIPPELRPYYREQAVAARGRYVAVRLLSALVVLVLLVGGGAWVWMHRQTIGHTVTTLATHVPRATHKQPSTTPPGNSQSQKKGTATKNDNKTADNNKQQTAPPAPSPSTAPSQPSGGTTDIGNQPTAQPTQPPTPTNTPPASTPIPNTGPGTVVLFGALTMSLLGGIIYHVRQRRTAHSS